MIQHFWRLNEDTETGLGPSITPEGMMLGRTPLVERRSGRFAVRDRGEIALLLRQAYNADIAVDRLMPGLAVVAAALNANDKCLASIAAVHLKIPDLPDVIARDNLETTDALVKYGDWNPALHPRTGTPPNPGWFAPTDGSSEARSGVEVTQNDDPNRRSDASASPTDNWVRLPAGPKRVDELADFVEWLANATPADEQIIRAEIKRYFYDAGDQGSAAALNSALSVVLRPGISRQDRQRILNSLDVFTRADPRDYVQTRDFLTGAAATILPGAGESPSGATTAESTATVATTAATRSEAWTWGWGRRGKYLDEQFRDGSLHLLSRTVDNFEAGGIPTSNKSVDLTAATYQSFAGLTRRLDKYLTEVEDYAGTDWGGDRIDPSQINGRRLRLIIPKDSITKLQTEAIDAARARASLKGIDLVVVEF